MAARCIGDESATDGCAVDDNLANTLLTAVGMDGDVIDGIAETACDSVVASSCRQAGVDEQAVVVGLDA